MTHDRRIQRNAIFLALLMVISVVGVSIAFVGSAAAASDATVSNDGIDAGVAGPGDEVVVQGVQINDGGSGDQTEIDRFTITNVGSASNSQIANVSLYLDDGTGADSLDDGDTQIGNTITDPALDSGVTFGADNGNAEITIDDGNAANFIVVVGISDTATETGNTVKTEFDASDIITGSFTADGKATATDANALDIDADAVKDSSFGFDTGSTADSGPYASGESVSVQYDAENEAGGTGSSISTIQLDIINSSGNSIASTTSGLSSGVNQGGSISVPSNTQDGTYSLQLTVTDTIGNTNTTTYADAFDVDNEVTVVSVASSTDPVSADGTLTLTGTAESTANDITFALEDGDGDSATVTRAISSTSFTVDIDLSTLSFSGGNGDGLSESTLDVYAVQEPSISTPFDDNDDAKSTGNGVDNTAPVFETPTPSEGSEVSGDPGTLKFPVSDSNSLSPGSVEVEIRNNGILLVDTIGDTASDDGVELDPGPTPSEVQIDTSKTEIPKFTDGSLAVDLIVADEAENQNSTQFSYTVDATGPSFTLDSPTVDSEVTSTTETIEATVNSNTGSADIDDATTSIKVIDEDDNVLYAQGSGVSTTNADSISYDADANQYTVSPTGGTPLPDGDTIDVELTADDSEGNSGSQTFQFAVDATEPSVEASGLELDDNEEVLVDDATPQVPVIINFDEEIDAGTVQAEHQVNGQTITIGDSDDPFQQSVTDVDQIENLDSTDIDDSSKVVALVDFSALDADTDTTLQVTQASDPAGNQKTTSGFGDNGDVTVNVDTQAPSVSEDPNDQLQDPIQGYVNIASHFTTSSDGGSTTFEYKQPNDDSYTTFTSSAENFDTVANLEEGQVTFRLTRTDDDGNSVVTTRTVTVDNADASVSATYTDGQSVTGSASISSAGFSQSNVGVPEVTYEYQAPGDSSFTTIGSGTGVTLDTQQFAPNTRLTLRATAQDVDGSTSATVDVVVGNSEGLLLREPNNNGELKIIVNSDSDLDELEVALDDTDYFENVQSTYTLGNFTENTGEDSGTTEYQYTLTTDPVAHDGKWTATVQKSSDVDVDSQNTIPTASGSEKVDNKKPQIDNVYLVGGDEDQTDLRVEFNEPLEDGTLAVSELSWSGSTSIDQSNFQNNDASGFAKIVLKKGEVQTGEDRTVDLSDNSVTEEYDQDNSEVDQNDASSGDAKFEVSLSQGINVVSIPSETGEVDLTNIEFPSEIAKISTYDESSGTFLDYNPGQAADDITEMRGGVGYVIRASDSTSFDVEVENRPLGSSVVAPDTVDVQSGYNLLGAFQEGQQPTEQAFTTLSEYSVERGYSGNAVTTVTPGQGYWVFSNNDGGQIQPVNYDGQISARPTIANIDTEVKSENGDAGFSQQDKIRVYATVSDDSLVNSVTLDNPNIGNFSDVTLTDEDNDGQFDKTFDGNTNGELAFTDGVTAGEPETLNVTAVDAEGNSASNTGETRAVESTPPTISSISYENNEGSDSDIDTAVLTFDEQIDVDNVDPADFTIDQDGQNVQADTVVDTTVEDSTFKVKITGDDSGIGTGTPQVNYTDADGGDGTTADFAGNGLADSTDLNSPASVTDNVAPEIISVTTFDTNGDGSVDAANLTASEPIQTSGLGSSSDYELAGNDVDSVNADEYSDQDGSTSDDSNSEFRIDYSSVSGTEAKEVNYDGSGVADGSGNALIELTDSDVSEIDGADPEATGAVYKDTNDDGSVEDVEVTFSEDLDTSTANIDAADFVFSGGDISQAADGVTGISGSVVTLDVSSAASGQGTDLSGPSLAYTAGTGSNTDPLEDADSPGTPDANEVEDFSGLSVADRADPEATGAAYKDTNDDGSVEDVEVTFSEDLDTSMANIDAADFVFSDGDIDAAADGVAGISGSVVTLDVSSAASGQGTDLSGPSLAYTAGTGSNTDPLEDTDSPGTPDANEVEDFSGLSVADSADAQVLTLQETAGGEITLTLSEQVGPTGDITSDVDDTFFSYNNDDSDTLAIDGSATVTDQTDSSPNRVVIGLSGSGTIGTSDSVDTEKDLEAGDDSIINDNGISVSIP